MARLEWNKDKEIYEIICEHCGEILATADEDYVRNYPNSCETWVDELSIEHESRGCLPEIQEERTHEIVCPDCGEVLATYDEDYAYHNPNGLEMWKGQLLTEHSVECPANNEYKSWNELLLQGVTHFGKEWELICHHSWFASSGNIYPQETYSVSWGKGGVESNSLEEILEAWSIALLDAAKAVYEKLGGDTDVLAALIEGFTDAAQYEAAKKGLLESGYTIQWRGELMAFQPKRIGRPNRGRNKSLIIEEA